MERRIKARNGRRRETLAALARYFEQLAIGLDPQTSLTVTETIILHRAQGYAEQLRVIGRDLANTTWDTALADLAEQIDFATDMTPRDRSTHFRASARILQTLAPLWPEETP